MSSQRSLPPVLRAFCIATVLFCAAMFVAEYIAVNQYGLDRVPYSRMTLPESDNFADADMYADRFDSFHTEDFFAPVWGNAWMYPAPLAFVYRFFYYFPVGTNWFLGTTSFLFLFAGVWFFFALRSHGLSLWPAIAFAGVSVGCSYPMYFALNRGNMEIFVWMLAGLGVYFFLKDKAWLAATFIGLAGACKFYPICYLGLLLLRKQYRQLVYSVLLAVAISVVGIWAVTGNFVTGQAGIAAGLEEFQRRYVLHRRYLEIGLDHSVFGFIKKIMAVVPPPEQLRHELNIYLALAAGIALIVFFWRVRKLPVMNQVLFITVVCITLPPLSSDYTLLHLYTPWVMLALFAVESWTAEGQTPRSLPPITVCMAVLLSSQTEIISHGERLNGQIKCVALVVLGIIAAVIPLKRERQTTEALPA